MRASHWLVSSGLLLICCAFVHAAPPTVTGLFPAGGQRGTTVDVTAIGTFDNWPVQVWASSPLISVTAGKDKGKLSLKLAKELIPGTYWLRCYDAQGASGLRPFIVGTLPENMEAEPNDTLAKAQPAQVPTVVNGKLNRNGDLDGYAVSLKQGQTLVASVESHQTLRSAADMVMQLADSAGTVITQNHDYHGLDPQITFTASKDGTYVVRLFAFPANPDSSIRYSGGELYFYRLTLTTGAFLDHAFPLAVNTSKQNIIRLRGWNLGSSTQTGMLHHVDDQAYVYHPEASGQAYMKVESWPVIDDSLAQRRSQSLTLPVSVTAALSKEQPAYQTRIALTKGKKVHLQALSQTIGLDVDPVLVVTDAAGKEVHRAAAAALHADVATSYTPTADGNYAITVSDLHGRVGWRQAFLLRIYPAEPGFSLTVDADRFTITAGKPLDIPVKIAMLEGLKESVQLKIEGLPGSVRWKVQSTTGPEAARVITLRLESKSPCNVNFRITGDARGATLSPQFAIANLADLGTTTSNFWLTSVK